MPLWPSSTRSAPWSHHGLNLQLAGLAVLALLHGVFLPVLSSAGLLLLLGWRWLAAHQRLPLPPRWLLLLLAFSGLAGVLAGFRTILGAEAGVALVMWLAGCKTLETRSPRDTAGLSLLGLFLAFSLILHQQDVLMTLAVSGLTWLFVLSLCADRLPAARRGMALRISGLLLLQALPLMAILFIAFPRLPGPLWQIPDLRPRYATGLSPTVAPGSVSRLVQSQAIAFRVRFIGEAPTSVELYWRGPVMSRFDGHSWSMVSSERTGLPLVKGRQYQYETTIEPHPMSWVYPLERPTRLAAGLLNFADGEVLAPQPIRERQRLQMAATLQARWPTHLSSAELQQNLDLPDGFSPRARQWGQQLQQRYPQARQRVAAILTHFATQDYAYTLQPPQLPGDWVDAFLYQSRRGFCEHYAGSMAFVLRAAGVPARVIGGYLGAEDNPIGGYRIVRQSDAHAWLEAWVDGAWERVDPTGVVVPSRLSEGLESALPEADAARLPGADYTWLRQMRLIWDSGQNRWNQLVIGYDDERRLRLLQRLGGLRSPVLTALLLIVAGTVLSLGLVWLWLTLRQRPRPPDATQREWQRLQKWLARRGLPRGKNEGPRDYLLRVQQQRPQAAATVAAFAELYMRLTYGRPHPRETAADLRLLRRQLQRQSSA